MGAPEGNQFWKLRSKHGRDKIFATPEILLEAAYEYFEHQSKQQWNKKEAIKSGEMAGTLIDIPTSSPFSLKSLCIFLDVNSVYFNQFEGALKENDNQLNKDFSKVITHIREIIESQQFEGATVGCYNPNIIARTLGLTDKTETDITSLGESINKIQLTESQIDKLIDRL